MSDGQILGLTHFASMLFWVVYLLWDDSMKIEDDTIHGDDYGVDGPICEECRDELRRDEDA
jgi:hypothetical protein